MAAKYLYVCENCLAFYSFSGGNATKCSDCGGTLRETDIESQGFRELQEANKKAIKDAYVKRTGMKANTRGMYAPKVKSGFSISALWIIAVIGSVACIAATVMSVSLLPLAGIPACAALCVYADMAYNVKCMKAMMEDRFYGKNRF